MRRPAVLLFILLFLVVGQATAQVPITLKSGITSGDTLRVEVVIGTPSAALPTSVSSFQFAVQVADTSVTFLDIDPAFTLADKEGWTVRANPDNGRVGGFSSSADAIAEGGVLLTLLFQTSTPCEEVEVLLDIFKLNAGNPGHYPTVPVEMISGCPQ